MNNPVDHLVLANKHDFFCIGRKEIADVRFKRRVLSRLLFTVQIDLFHSSTYLMIFVIEELHMELRIARVSIPRQASLPPEEDSIQ